MSGIAGKQLFFTGDMSVCHLENRKSRRVSEVLKNFPVGGGNCNFHNEFPLKDDMVQFVL